MKTDKVTIHNIFDKQVRYLVPIFQRGYVWKREDQWEPLWQDIIDQIKTLVRHRENNSNIRKHFLGSIVLNYYPTSIKHINAYEIIDGQQRLLTLQTLLIAFRDSIKPLNDSFLNSRLQLLTGNSGELFEPSEIFKVWPTNAYHEDLNRIINAGSMEALQVLYPQKKRYGKYIPTRPRLVEAYLFFSEAINDYLNDSEVDDENERLPNSPEERVQRATLLYEVFHQYIQLVEITLEAEDDPQVIFETLNYRGVPLEASDLIRNFLFLNASRQNKDVEFLYSQYWKDFDKLDGKSIKFWKEMEKQGRLRRSRLDLFFFHYVTYRTISDIRISHLYQEFKDWWENSYSTTLEYGLSEIQKCSCDFEKFLTKDTNDELGALSFGLKILDTSTVYPLLLWLCSNKDKLAHKGDFEGILKDIESYLIRRLVCNLTTKNYNRIFLNLLSKIDTASTPTRATIQDELLALTGDSGIWPNDNSFLSSLINEPLYKTIKPRRVNMLLTALEIASRTNRQEMELAKVTLKNSLTIEHVMPQSFKPEEWPYPQLEIANPQEPEQKRKNIIHSLGNLTLLTQPMNSEISNGPFRNKRPEITKKSLLMLNSYFQQFSDDDYWNEETIVERSGYLAKQAVKLWGYPGA